MGSSSKNCVNAYTTLFSTPWKRRCRNLGAGSMWYIATYMSAASSTMDAMRRCLAAFCAAAASRSAAFLSAFAAVPRTFAP